MVLRELAHREFAPGEDETSAAKGLPGGLGFSVGKTLDARIPNTHWLPDYGPDSTAASSIP